MSHDPIRLENLRSALQERVGESATRAIATGAEAYRREQHLPALIGQEWRHLTDAEIVARLQRKLRQMERLCLATGHWAGDAHRVIALRQAIAGEQRDGN